MSSVTTPPVLEPPQGTFHSGASLLDAQEREQIAIQALGRHKPILQLAEQFDVSRKFIYQQSQKAQSALDEVFRPPPTDRSVLFYIPVTKQWLEQLVLGAILHCHSSYRGVQGLLHDIFDQDLSIGAVHNIVMSAVESAQLVNQQEDLSAIRVGAHDEIFQGDPILVGVDPHTTYCYLLAQEPQRDGTTWGLHLLELSERGLDLEYTVADAGKGLRAGQAEAWPSVPCRGDVFHATREMGKVTTYLDNRAVGRIAEREKLEQRMERAKKKLNGQSFSKKLALVRQKETQAVELADDMRVLAQWLREDILSLRGPALQTRQELFDFVVDEMRAREHLAPHRIRPVRVALENQRDDLLAFAGAIDEQLDTIAKKHRVALADVREVFEMGHFLPADPRHWQKDAALWKQLGSLYPLVRQEVEEVLEGTVRASSMVENLNSRLRCYFFLRRTVGPEYLELLRFFLNHRRYPRSRREHRVGKSPAELLQGKPLPHWLEQLGYKRFLKAA